MYGKPYRGFESLSLRHEYRIVFAARANRIRPPMLLPLRDHLADAETLDDRPEARIGANRVVLWVDVDE